MHEKPHVLLVVQSLDAGRALLRLLAVLGLARVDSLEDAEVAKLVQGQLQNLHSLRPRDVRRGLAGPTLRNNKAERKKKNMRSGSKIVAPI